MPHLLALVFVGAGIYAGYRLAGEIIGGKKKSQRRDQTPKGAKHRASEPRDLGDLRYDPSSGAYVPANRKHPH